MHHGPLSPGRHFINRILQITVPMIAQPDKENIWGSLFQWGRIADGHELRSYTVNIGVDTVANNIQAYT